MRSHLRFASVIGAVAVGAIAVAPAMAATTVSQAGANAVTVSLAGNKQGTGNVTATNDGSSEKKTGDATPPVSVLQGQSLFQGGALAQEATAGANGHSAACAGLAGNGGSVVNIGGSSCLSPGQEVHATLSSLDLSKLIVADPSSALADLNQVTGPILTQLTPHINDAVAQVRAQFGDFGLIAGFGAVEGRCTASRSSASGDANLVDAGIRLQAPGQGGQPGQSVTLLDLPVHPKPNTHLTTNLSDVLDMISEALKTDLNNSLDGGGAPLNVLIDAFQENIVTAVRDQVEKNLAPLEENVLDVILNKQSHTPGAIKVNAIDMQILPAAKAQLGASAAELQIGNVACGPGERVAQAASAVEAPSAMPTAVSAGLATAPGVHAPGDDSHNGIVLAALAMMLTGGTALVVIRWLRA